MVVFFYLLGANRSQVPNSGTTTERVTVTLRDRYYVDLSDFRQFHIITILGRPPGIMSTSQHTHYAGGIVMIITIVHDGTHKRTYIYNNDSPSQEYKGYTTKIQYQRITTERAMSVKPT